MKIKLLIPIFLFLLFSCTEKNTELICEANSNDNYAPLSVESYWIYHWYKIDTLENEELLPWADTVRVLKDTLIGLNNYAVIAEQNHIEYGGENHITYKRDSLGYLVNEKNEIFFSDSNFTDTLHFINTPTHEIVYKMNPSNFTVQTPVGEFDCLNFQGKVIPFINAQWTEQFFNKFYAKDIGKVQGNYFFFNSAHIYQYERRLVEYHIE